MAASSSKEQVVVQSGKDRSTSVDNAINQIQRQFGKGSIMRLGTHVTEPIPVIPINGLPTVTPRQHVVNGTFVLQSQLSRHLLTLK